MTASPQGDTEITPSAEQPAQQPAEQRPKRSLRAWIAIGVGVLLVVVLGLPMALTATPSECSLCHEMQPYYNSWKSSSHAGAASNCLYCHARPGVLGYLGFQMGYYAMLAGHASGAKVQTTAANSPAVQSCSRPECHSLNREVSNSGDIKINHRTHVVQAGIPCTRCHPGAVHAGVDGRRKLPPMSLCKTCHASKMQQCGYCHNEQRLGAPPAGSGH